MKVNSRADSEPITFPLEATQQFITAPAAVFEGIVIKPGTLWRLTESGRGDGDCALTYFPHGGVNALFGLQDNADARVARLSAAPAGRCSRCLALYVLLPLSQEEGAGTKKATYVAFCCLSPHTSHWGLRISFISRNWQVIASYITIFPAAGAP